MSIFCFVFMISASIDSDFKVKYTIDIVESVLRLGLHLVVVLAPVKYITPVRLISDSQLWTFHFYEAKFEQHFHFKFIPSFDILELAVPWYMIDATNELLNKGFKVGNLKSHQWKLLGCHHELVDRYRLSMSHIRIAVTCTTIPSSFPWLRHHQAVVIAESLLTINNITGVNRRAEFDFHHITIFFLLFHVFNFRYHSFFL